MRTELLTIDGVFNVLLGVVLVWYPLSVADALGLPASGRPFFASVLGGVLFGIGVALLVERFRRRTDFIGLGLGGAVAINLCGAVVLAAWLSGSSLALTAFLPERGRMMQVWADYLDRLRTGEEPEANATASKPSEVLVFRAHDGRLP